jgi:hypothetical protein
MACSWTLAGLATAEAACFAGKSARPWIIVNNASKFDDFIGPIVLNY